MFKKIFNKLTKIVIKIYAWIFWVILFILACVIFCVSVIPALLIFLCCAIISIIMIVCLSPFLLSKSCKWIAKHGTELDEEDFKKIKQQALNEWVTRHGAKERKQ